MMETDRMQSATCNLLPDCNAKQTTLGNHFSAPKPKYFNKNFKPQLKKHLQKEESLFSDAIILHNVSGQRALSIPQSELNVAHTLGWFAFGVNMERLVMIR